MNPGIEYRKIYFRDPGIALSISNTISFEDYANADNQVEIHQELQTIENSIENDIEKIAMMMK